VDKIESTDAQRSAMPLKHAQNLRIEGGLTLANGAQLADVDVCYETWGELNAAGSNAVLICHALSGDSHVARHDADDEPGWWEIMVGPGRPIDTDRYFVICSNVLGGCRGTTGPNILESEYGRPYGAEFPVVSVSDMVEVQRRLVDHLGIERLRAVVGGSLGGLQVLQWAITYPSRVEGAIVVAASPRLSSQGIAFDVVGRNAIRQDVHFRDGQYYQDTPPEVGLALARMLAHITYLSDESMRKKFDPTRMKPRAVDSGFESTFSVGSYLAHQGDRFVERFDANSYITLSTAMDIFDLGGTDAELRHALEGTTCRWLFLSFSSDWLYPPSASRALVDALVAQGKPVGYCEIESAAGHDSFLIEDNMRRGCEMIASFLTHTGGEATATPPRPGVTRKKGPRGDATSIFHGRRLDYEMILEMLPPHGSVVDLGCGDGELLAILKERGYSRLLGLERDEASVAEAIGRGLDVIHADLDDGLGAIADHSFDVALLSQTLQSVVDVAGVLDELVRVSWRGIVSFPNFAHHSMREMFLKEGRLPKGEGEYGYEWYDTPNRRFPSILDFHELCEKRGLVIAQAVYIDSATGHAVTEDPNLHADLAIVALTR